MPKLFMTCVDGVWVLATQPEHRILDFSHLDEFTKATELAETLDPPLLVLDLKETEYISSAFLGLVFRLSIRMKKLENGRFGLCNIGGFCRDVIKTHNMDAYLELFENRAEAIAAFSSNNAGSSSAE